MRQAVYTGTPVAGAPYTPAIIVRDLVFVSGQVGLNSATRQLAEGGFEPQLRQCLANLQLVLQAAGTDLSNVVKMTVFLKDMDNFQTLNGIYRTYWTDILPARTCIQAARLPMDAEVELEAIAALPTADQNSVGA